MSRQINFIDRENDLAWLENEYHKKGAGFIVIYGRRRVGKTTLIEEFIRDKKAIYFMADKQVEKELINRFNQAMSRSIDDPLMSDLTFNSWETLFEYWLGKEKFQTKIVVVIDEFQYLAKVNPAFPSILQRIWDERLKRKIYF
jgi:AAA+ ATPase superfamily predicted ATPase